jgi:cytochrome c556
MSLPKLVALLSAGALAATFALGAIAQDVVADPAIAAMSPEQLVEARVAAMKQNGGLLRGAGGLSGADAVAAADTLLQNYTNFKVLFPEGSAVGSSEALPAIWENEDAFLAIFDQGIAAAQQMKAAAEAGNADAYGAALKALGGTCGQCHQQFRA